MPGLLEVALDRGLVLAEPAGFRLQLDRADFAMRAKEHQIGESRRGLLSVITHRTEA